MNAEAAIVHVNIIGFMAAVELARDRSLAASPFVVGVAGAGRAVVLDSSPLALREGIEPGSSLQAARRHLPELRILPPDAPAYRRIDERLERLAGRYAPLVQNDTGGHLFLDLGGTRRLFGPYVDTAARLRNEIADDLGLDSAVALAGNKLVAKVGTRSIRPDGLAVVRPGEEAGFLAPQDAALLPGVGPRLKRALDRIGLGAIGDVAALTDAEALALFGARFAVLRDAARGRDDSPVASGRPADRSVAGRRDFAEPVLDDDSLRGTIIDLAAELSLNLRRNGLGAFAAALTLRYADGAESRAATAFKRPLRLEADFMPIVDGLLRRARQRRLRVAGLDLNLSQLTALKGQLDLFDLADGDKAERLQAAADAARDRFGFAALARGSALLPRRLCVQT